MTKAEQQQTEKLGAASDRIHDTINACQLTVVEAIVSLAIVLKNALKMRHCDCENCCKIDVSLAELIKDGLQSSINAKKVAVQ